jgi:hypothetical protein
MNEQNTPQAPKSSGGGPAVAIGLGALIIIAAVVLVMTINTKPVESEGEDHTGHDHATAPMTTDAEPAAEKAAEDKPAAAPADEKKQDIVELEIELPNPVFAGTPKDIPQGVNINRKRHGKPREPFYTVPGLTNVARDKDVTSSDPYPIIGDLDLVADGDKEALDGRFVELAPGKQWVQVNLGDKYEIHAVMMWHNHLDPRVYRDVVVQVSDDPEFKEGVKTVYNNDNDNSSGFGVGEDFEYFENFEGELGPVKGVVGQYVRFWSKGSTSDDQNHYTEVEVYARKPQ